MSYLCIRKQKKTTINTPEQEDKHGKKIMKTTAIAQFENDLNDRLEFTINTMMENKEWRKIFSTMSMKQIADTIGMVFCATAIKPGKENADNFMKAFNAMVASK